MSVNQNEDHIRIYIDTAKFFMSHFDSLIPQIWKVRKFVVYL